MVFDDFSLKFRGDVALQKKEKLCRVYIDSRESKCCYFKGFMYVF